jgi:hypothetical protein
MNIYDKYDICCFEMIEESEEIQHGLRICPYINLRGMFLDNDDQLLKVWNMCHSATKVIFPDDLEYAYRKPLSI